MVDRPPGRATSEGTRRLADRSCSTHALPAAHFRATAGDLRLSSIGLGTYIGAPDAATDRAVEEAVSVCLTSGRVNVVDTAINYRHQRAERSIGRALARAFDRGAVRRDEVFVATKAGYLAPDAEAGLEPTEWIEQELLRPGTVKPSEIVDGSHVMTPAYLEDQLERSRRNLGLATIDVFHLHNAADAQLPVVGRSEFMRRLDAAFRFLEGARRDGRITSYGLATWESLRARRGEATYLSLEEVVDLAQTVGGDQHGFRFVQFPFNVGMPEALVLKNQPVGREKFTLFGAAQQLNVGCFTSVPLYQGQLADSGIAVGELTSAQSALQFARSAPGTLGPMVGQKSPEHLSENLAVAEKEPWDLKQVNEFLA